MQILSFSQARAGLKQAMDDVCRDHEPAVITRQRGDAVVLVSLTDYNAMAETMYLLGTECNATRLRRSIASHQAGKASLKEISLHVAEAEETE
ncbi:MULTISPECIES: type II toxin-antitoxin system Phd/YefM family antitoxin [Pseudomonas]|jgi:antitoxin YefM|uniref:Antitoxin n=1 Tax=Pseudomonas syringae pv. papulans TaxID=83963 RepID=A0AA43DZF1_PSESX|nr:MULTISPECIES: type II toxin-antitoxin system prevent-host-death family antitoxin [Pseudomonas]MDH4603787.1 type II toxin-antitoxin system prevent-host-death family antitoxin [Pseudomonas syringae pv. papulans]MDH4625598.1 type II toxin-antitoxin system prevent-host-death family antitoxin [Pseudomonas syringae pv. papulans]